MQISNLAATGVLSLALTGCGSNLKMQWGVPLEVDRGCALDYTRFNQRGKQVDRSHVKTELEEYEESAPAMKRATNFETGSTITRVVGVGGLLIGSTLLQQENKGAVPLIAVGGGFLGLSIGLSFIAEGNYVEAVERYNERVGGSESELSRADRGCAATDPGSSSARTRCG